MDLLNVINLINLCDLSTNYWAVSVNGCSTAHYTGIEDEMDETFPPHLAIWYNENLSPRLHYMCHSCASKVLNLGEDNVIYLFFQ